MDRVIQEASRIRGRYGVDNIDQVARQLGMAVYDCLEGCDNLRECYFPRLEAAAVSPDVPSHVRRFLIAHALAHHLLHRDHRLRDYIGAHIPLVASATEGDRAEISRTETEADLFAAYLLLPQDRLCKVLEQDWAKHSKDPVNEIALELQVPPDAVRVWLVYDRCQELQRQSYEDQHEKEEQGARVE